MNAGWEISTLGEILAVLRNGINCKQSKNGKGEKISRIESISDATFNADKVGYAELSERDKTRYLLHPGDILFSHINSPVHVGKTAVFDSSESIISRRKLVTDAPEGYNDTGLFGPCTEISLPEWLLARSVQAVG